MLSRLFFKVYEFCVIIVLYKTVKLLYKLVERGAESEFRNKKINFTTMGRWRC